MNTSQAKILIVEIGEYVFSVGSTGDSPVSSGDPPDGIGRGIERKGAVLSQPHVTAIPPGGSPGGAGGSPVVFGRRFALRAHRIFSPSPPQKRRRGPGRGGAFYQLPLSPTLSPL